MSAAKWASLLSTTSALTILISTYWAWAHTAYGGPHVLHRWVKFGLLPTVIVLQCAGLVCALSASG